MKRYKIRLSPEGGTFHPFDAVLIEEERVHRVAVHQFKLIDDDRGVMLYEFAGDLDRTEALMDDLLGDLGYELHAFDGRIFVYSMFIPNATLRQLSRIPRDHDVFRIPPLLYTEDGDLLETYIGTEEAFRRAVSAIPDEVSVHLEEKRDYHPHGEPFLEILTERQRTVFLTAVELGYYDTPRQATYQDIGDHVGLAGGTVGEHLRTVERQLVDHVLTDHEHTTVTGDRVVTRAAQTRRAGVGPS